MDEGSKSSSNDKQPDFLSNRNENIEEFINKKNDNTNLDNVGSNTRERKSSNINWISLGIGAGIAVACIFCGVLLVNMINTDSTQVLDEITIKEITSMQKPTIASFYDNASPLLGNPNASITLVEFGDYQCTFCKKFFHETGESILTNYIKTGKVKMLFKDFIIVGDDSVNAAVATHCANDQNMFWQYHSILYENWDGEGTGWASINYLHQFAATLGLDMDEFSECMSQSKWKELVNSSHADGRALGVDATPTFFIINQNNEAIKITGAQNYNVFKDVFDSLLEN